MKKASRISEINQLIGKFPKTPAVPFQDFAIRHQNYEQFHDSRSIYFILSFCHIGLCHDFAFIRDSLMAI